MRRKRFGIVLAFVLCAAARRTAAAPPVCAVARDALPVSAPELTDSAGISTANLRAWVGALAAPALRGRQAGTDDSRRSARLIAEYLKQLGAQPARGSDYCQAFSIPGLHDQNVVGMIPPTASARSSDVSGRWVVLGAHYDALGVDAAGKIRPGADDNASGVAVLLEVARQVARARQMADTGNQATPGVVFVAFGAEEPGLYGSAAYVREPPLPLESVSLMINVDMAGRLLAGNAGIGYQATGQRSGRTVGLVRKAARAAHVSALPMNLGDRSDNASFPPFVPSVFFSTTIHADYHRPTDSADRVDYAQVTRAARLVLALIEHAPQ